MTEIRNLSTRTGSLVVSGGLVPSPQGHGFRNADVVVESGDIVRCDQHSELRTTGPRLDASGCSVVPGFIDVQVNGAFGIDLTSEPQRVGELASQLPHFGVTAFCPTVITGPESTVPHAIDAVREAQRRATETPHPSARILGIHAEGPYIAQGRTGTHPTEHARAPSTGEVQSWLDMAGPPGGGHPLAIVTLAPELPGASDVIDMLVAADITVCIGHTDASAEDIALAEARGATAVTHLFNAMSQLGHRRPGGVGGTLASRTLIAGLIADGLHVDPTVVAIAWRVLGPERTALVTDSIAALGIGEGRFKLGGVAIDVAGGTARNAAGGLAGSVLSMDHAVRNLIEFTGCSLSDASRAASSTPARLVGAPAAALGSIQRGHRGDLVLLNESLEVAATVIAGIVVHDPEHRLS
jgi:N-acetylglucosamine-6-phosphate deacetylase